MKDWVIPSIGFGIFIYFMLFVILYAIKISGPNVSFFDTGDDFAPPKNESERFLQDISKSIKK